jgi:hypothetical protein
MSNKAKSQTLPITERKEFEGHRGRFFSGSA